MGDNRTDPMSNITTGSTSEIGPVPSVYGVTLAQTKHSHYVQINYLCANHTETNRISYATEPNCVRVLGRFAN